MPFDFLDISPLIRALGDQPEDFALQGTVGKNRVALLEHPKSGHNFILQPTGETHINAHCGCSTLRISHEQGQQLREAVGEWDKSHWQGEVAKWGGEEMARVALLRVQTFGQHTHYPARAFDGRPDYNRVNKQFARHFEPTPEQLERIIQRELAQAEERQEVLSPPDIPKASALATAFRELLGRVAKKAEEEPIREPVMGYGDD